MTSASRWAALAAAAILFAGPAASAEKRFGLTSFEAIEVDADFIVEVTTRAPVGAVAIGTPEALDRVSLETRDGRLVIGERRFAGDERRTKPQAPVTIRVNAVNLRSAMLGGAGALHIDRLKGTRVSIGLRGPGEIRVGEVIGDRLSVAMIGNGTMTLAGSVKQAQATLSGAGSLDAGALVAGAWTSDSEGAGDHVLRAEKSATITARGIGRTVVLGRPTCTVRNIGSGSVTCGQAR